MVGIRVSDWGRGDVKREYLQFWGEMFPVVVRAVEASFLDAGMKNPTQAEVKDRIKKAKRIVEELRIDLKWSRPRIKNELARILRNRILGISADLDHETAKGQRQSKEVKGVVTTSYAVSEGTTPELQASPKLQADLNTMYNEEEEADLAEPAVEATEADVVETADPDDLAL